MKGRWYRLVNKEFHQKKRKDLMADIMDKSLVVLFAGEAPKKTGDQRYPFTPNRNFYYLTGMDKEKMALIMSKYENEIEEILLIEKPNARKESRIGKMIDIEEAKEITGISKVRYIDEIENCIVALLNNTGALVERDFKYVYFDFEVDNFSEPLNKTQVFAKKTKDYFPFLNIENIHHNICNMRIMKEPEEIEKIRRAIDITNKGIENIMRNIRPSIMEYELEAIFDFELKTRGVRNTAFNTIAASGKNAVSLHYEDNNSMVGEKELVLFDLGAEYDYYSADISRTFPSSGKFTERQRELYNIVLKAQEETIKAMNPGQELEGLIDITRDVLIEECKKIGLIEFDHEISKYFFHGVSHYLGLDTHDVGNRNVKLKPGMVLTVEPGLYIPEEAIGIRIEDDVLITDNGHEVLSKDIMKNIDDIEKFMNEKKIGS